MSAITDVAPFAVSTATVKFSLSNSSKASSKFFLKKYKYSSNKSSLISDVPILFPYADNSFSFPESKTSSISSSISSGNFIPLFEKYLIPLNSNVLWDAEITTLASAFNFFVKYAIPGVGITPTSFTLAP